MRPAPAPANRFRAGRAPRRTPPIDTLAHPTELSVIIPAYNEAERLPGTLAAVRAWMDGVGYPVELVVVDDGSRDGTGAIIEAAAAEDPRVRAVVQPENGGKGAAIEAGVKAARGGEVVFFDADLSYDLGYVAAARAALAAGADLAIGTRDAGPEDTRKRGYSLVRRAASWAFNRYVEGLLRLGVSDTQCGFKAFRREVAEALFDAIATRGFGFDVELLYLARRWGLEIALVPVGMEPRGGSSVNVLRHSVTMARDVLRIRRRARRGEYPATIPR
ncbi:MAG: glycosyltransferase [Myxococcales bacterium]|nr:glycosyltransferase [Myxococcales bacterium]MCB9736184.1 glycosyltransferase [Deltaproteobacteria bacterium]